MGIVEEEKTRMKEGLSERPTQDSSNEFKMSNEYGIAGFVMALLLPCYKLILVGYNSPNYLIEHTSLLLRGDLVERFESEVFSYWIYIFLILLALFLAIKGLRKNSQKFQKGLAFAGLIIASLVLINVSISIFSEQPEKGSMKPSKNGYLNGYE